MAVLPLHSGMDLAKLTNGLALVKQGLDELDARIRDELNLCSQLRRKAAAQRQHTQQLHSQVAEAREQLFAQQDEQEDLRTLLNCLIEQTGRARGRKQDMQVGRRTPQLGTCLWVDRATILMFW